MYNGIVGKARNRIAGHYRLNGNISEQVQWLLERSHFLYGDIDIEVKYLLVLIYLTRLIFSTRKKRSTMRNHSATLLSRTLFKLFGSHLQEKARWTLRRL